MKCFIGIDLGSTTTKAVVLDETGDILGRGITNSRSNYDVACEVARGEALVDAHFQLFRRAARAEPTLAARVDELLPLIRQGFRLEQYLYQLGDLREITSMNAERGGHGAPAQAALTEIFDTMAGDAFEQFQLGAPPRSDFFRDMAGARFMSLAEEHSNAGGVAFETLLGLYDKSIIQTENHSPDVSFHDLVERAIERISREDLVPVEESGPLRRVLGETLGTHLVAAATVGTGYGRARLPFPKEFIRSEILCHGLGAHATFPDTRTVLDIGGQDTKAIQVDAEGVVESFQMNDRCAAGCGRYLGYIADEMNMGLHQLGPMAMKSKKKVRISSTCTVFAGAEFRDRLAMGQRREDILAGLHRAIMLRAMSLLARSGGIRDEFTFTGGVARNEAAVAALRQLVVENYGERVINVSPTSIYTGALGAALFALRSEGGEEQSRRQVAAAGGVN